MLQLVFIFWQVAPLSAPSLVMSEAEGAGADSVPEPSPQQEEVEVVEEGEKKDEDDGGEPSPVVVYVDLHPMSQDDNSGISPSPTPQKKPAMRRAWKLKSCSSSQLGSTKKELFKDGEELGDEQEDDLDAESEELEDQPESNTAGTYKDSPEFHDQIHLYNNL